MVSCCGLRVLKVFRALTVFGGSGTVWHVQPFALCYGFESLMQVREATIHNLTAELKSRLLRSDQVRLCDSGITRTSSAEIRSDEVKSDRCDFALGLWSYRTLLSVSESCLMAPGPQLEILSIRV